MTTTWRTQVVATVLLTVALAVAGCGGGDDPAADATGSGATGEPSTTPPPTEPTEPPETVPAPEPLTPEQAQPVVDQALIDGTVLELQPRDTPNTGTGLERSTFGFCEAADAGTTGEDLRVARTQRWWSNPTYRTGAPGGVSVGNEVVHYQPGGAQQYLDALAAVPQDCAGVAVIDGDTYEFSAEPVPDGLPEGAASLRLAVQHSEGAATVGYVVAIASGDVLSVLYVYGNDAATADAFVPEALALVQDELAAARPGTAA